MADLAIATVEDEGKAGIGKMKFVAVVSLILVALLCSIFILNAAQNTKTLTWIDDQPDIAQYRLYCSETSNSYPVEHIAIAPDVRSYDINLEPGKDYYFVITAVNTKGLESAYSNEVSIIPPKAPVLKVE